MSTAGQDATPPKLHLGPKRAGPVRVRGSLPATFDKIPWAPLLQAALIVAVGFWIYWPDLNADWLWDDDIDITMNPVTQSPTGLWSIWFVPGSQLDYYPVKASVQWFQWHWWGNDTTGYHVTNVALHILGSLLVWRLLGRFGLRLAWLGGLIFALHPAQVESVAWITELKNTLAMPLFLLALCAWFDYEAHGRRRDYGLALAFFVVAMLTKPAMAAFPVVILLYAWWKRARIGWSDLKASGPFFAVSLFLGVLSLVLVDRYRHIHPMANGVVPLGGFFSRMELTGLDLAFYFEKTVWPVGLLPYYPQWPVNPPSWTQFWPWPVMAAVAVVFWWKRGGWGRHALLGLGYFVIMLAPFVTMNVGGYTTYTWVMDHFLYFPILGPIGLTVAALGELAARRWQPLRILGGGLIAVPLVALAWGSREYATLFADSEALCEYTLRANPDCWVLHYNLGVALGKRGRIDDEIEQYRETLQLRPNNIDASYNWGLLLLQLNRPKEAVPLLEAALKYAPDDVRTLNNLGGAFMATGRYAEAIEQYEAALKTRPDFVDANYNLGSALCQEGRYAEAIPHLQTALSLNPRMVLAGNCLGIALAKLGRSAEAKAQLEQVLQIDPANDAARHNLAWLQGQASYPPPKK
jgi:tetratricopeptide (TPR) repeat protein